MFIISLAVWIFSACGTALFFSKSAPPSNVAKENRQQRLNTESSKNRTTKGDIYQEITLKILDSSGNAIRDGNTQNDILYIEVTQNLYLDETKATARFFKYLPDNDPEWIADGRKTLPYSELGKYYSNKDELIAVQTVICAKQKKTFDDKGYYIYEPKPVTCPQ